MTDKKWYHSSYRRNLIDMHIPDWNPEFFSELNTEEYVQNLKKANVDTAYIYTTSCVGLCNFPTKVGKMHEGLHGRDIIREITDGCRKEGIRPVLYINFWSKWAYDNYPDWRCVSPEGKGSLEYMFEQPGRYGVLCLNSQYRDFFVSLVKELMEAYETDGLWIDMLLYRTMCTCHHCKKRFEDETGYKFPETINMADPVYVKYVRKREEWISEYLDEIKAVVYEKNPDAAVVYNSAYHPPALHGMSLDFAQETEFITGDASLGPVRSFEAKLFNNVTKNHPFEFLCSVMDPDLTEHSMLKTEEHLLQLLTSCLAHNGRNGFIDAIDPYGSLNPMVYERMRKVYDETDKYIPFLETEMEMCADAAIYTNFSCMYSPEDDGKRLMDVWESSHLNASKKVAARLVEQNISYDVITPKQLDKLNKYKTLILPDVYVLSDSETEAIREYVKNGGTLYASGRCAVYDNEGGKNDEGRLADVLGVRLCGKTDEKLTYIRPTENSSILKDYSAKHPLSCRGWQALVTADDDTEILGKLTLPIVNPSDTTKFASAISDPPGKITDYPSVVAHRYGKGKTVYCAALLENFDGRDHSALFGEIVGELIGENKTFVSNAPHPVEIVMYRQKESKNYVINITNSLLPVLTLCDIDVKLHIPEDVKLYSAPDKQEVEFVRDGEYISFTIPKLRVFEMLIAEPQ